MKDVIPLEEFFASTNNMSEQNVTALEQKPSEPVAIEEFFQPPPAEKKGFIDKAGDILRERGGQIQERVAATRLNPQQKGEQTPLETAAQVVAGQVGAAGQVAAEGGIALLDAPTPQLLGFTPRQVSSIVGAVIPKEAMQNIDKAKQFISNLANKYSENLEVYNALNPRAGRNLQAIRELGELLPFKTVAGKEVVKGLSDVGGGVVDVAKSTMGPKEISPLFGSGGLDSEAFSSVRQSLKDQAKLEAEKIGGLFKEATERGQSAFIPDKDINELANKMVEMGSKEVDLEAKKLFEGTANTLRGLTKEGQSTGILDAEGVAIRRPTFNNINEIEGLRRSASRASASTEGGKRFAGGAIARELDNFLGSGERVTGDKDAVNKWKEAISTRRDFGQKFETPTVIAKAIEDGTDESIEAAFIGSGGASLNKELANNYKAAIKALPMEKKKLGAFRLRQAIVDRWIKNAARATDEADSISAARMSNQIKNFRIENKSMWGNFPKDEQKVLLNLEDKLRNVGKSGVIDTIAAGLAKMARASRVAGNVELPRTLKPKTIVSIDELLNLTKTPKEKARNIKARNAPEPEVTPPTPPQEMPPIEPKPTAQVNDIASKIADAIIRRQEK